jgi:excisionase family DNA binding protein
MRQTTRRPRPTLSVPDNVDAILDEVLSRGRRVGSTGRCGTAPIAPRKTNSAATPLAGNGHNGAPPMIDWAYSTPPQRLAYTVADFLKATGIGRTSFYAEVGAGRLRVVKVGKRTLIRAEAVNDWFELLEAEAGEAAQKRSSARRQSRAAFGTGQ